MTSVIERAESVVRRAYGPVGLHAVAAFLSALPSDCTLCWGDEPRWIAADVAAQGLEDAANEPADTTLSGHLAGGAE